jgi:hypothetical protein
VIWAHVEISEERQREGKEVNGKRERRGIGKKGNEK